MKNIRKISKVIEFIENNLTKKLDLDQIAAAVHYSKYHLHRLFAEVTGLTIHEYVQRRQLTEAAKLLIFSKKPIIEIAAIAGYESQQAFTNVFTAMYKQPPNQYREKEKFYPLQLKFEWEGNHKMLNKLDREWEIAFATEEDIPTWMDLVHLVIDGFPYLEEEEYTLELKRRIKMGQALILKDCSIAVGIMLFSYNAGSIDFMGTHPLYRKKGIPEAFLQKVMGELIKEKDISITTYREGDKADTGHRKTIQDLGFAEAELLTEFGYPTQRFILQREAQKAEEPSFPDEVTHLQMISERIESAVESADANVVRIDQEYMEAKRYMVDYRGEIDPHEMFQNEMALKQIDRKGNFAVNLMDKLVKLKDSPYFARVDFKEKDEEEQTKYYIGRFAFSHKDELLIFDWRAPISSLFYDSEIGNAGYDAPVGRIDGELTLKRQLKVKNGVLEYVLESSTNVQDDVLQRELSNTSDEKMKSIIGTIQKEQNEIIRNEKAGTMIIQGVAGSGKTSIALHRIAYLLYRFKDKLSASNIMILSPNKVFGDYISNVLPELGEEPICQLGFVEIAKEQLKGIAEFEPDKDPLETNDAKWEDRVRYKSSLNFVKLIDKYLIELFANIFVPVDYTFGRFVIEKDWIWSRFCSYESEPVKKRLTHIADDIINRLELDNYMGEEMPKSKDIMKQLSQMLKFKNSLDIYKHLYQWLNCPQMCVLPKKRTLEWADVFPLLYIQDAYEGLNQYKTINHLVIDEMQDYTPIQLAVINRLFHCKKTILGDFGQLINKNYSHNLSDVQEIFEGAIFVELNKSYRSTFEIITFARSIQTVKKMEPIERHGDVPKMLPCKDKKDEISKIKERLEAFKKSNRATLGIILKTNKIAGELYELLSKEYELQYISPDSANFSNGISITSVKMSKGLEFDEVIIPDADDENYHEDHHRSLLYIACTRPLHQLSLFYIGKPSIFLPKL